MTERRYTDEEAAAIFQRASEAQHTGQQQLTSGNEGMTLARLQEIGREVGIAPDLVANAATAIDRVGLATSRRMFGLPIGVGRTIDLGRKLTEEEWERLVVDLRETFDARGRVQREGSLRQWTNGNLQVLLEPTATGHRVRLRTIKGNARSLMVIGLGGVVYTTIAGAAGLVTGLVTDPLQLAFFALMGAGIFGLGALRVPSWARTRRQQMEEIAERLALVANSPATTEGPTP
jgi:hypothetical protein